MEDRDWQHYAEVVARLNKVPIYVDDTPKLSVAEVSNRVLNLVNKTGTI